MSPRFARKGRRLRRLRTTMPLIGSESQPEAAAGYHADLIVATGYADTTSVGTRRMSQRQQAMEAHRQGGRRCNLVRGSRISAAHLSTLDQAAWPRRARMPHERRNSGSPQVTLRDPAAVGSHRRQDPCVSGRRARKVRGVPTVRTSPPVDDDHRVGKTELPREPRSKEQSWGRFERA
jgi:hypothetical protein